MKSFLILLIAGSGFLNSGFRHNTFLPPENQKNKIYGYNERGDSIEFIFGQQNVNTIGITEFSLDKRRGEILSVHIAGEFNGWKPDDARYQMKKDNKLFILILYKSTLGKKGERRQFKFVINGKYWIEPPKDAVNKFTGKDGNTNLYLTL